MRSLENDSAFFWMLALHGLRKKLASIEATFSDFFVVS